MRPLVPLLGRFDPVVRFPEGGGAGGAVFVEVPASKRSCEREFLSRVFLFEVQDDGRRHYLSNQYPNTPLADCTPPTWMPSLRQRSSPWKMDQVVQRTSPSGVSLTVPRAKEKEMLALDVSIKRWTNGVGVMGWLHRIHTSYL